MVIEHGRAFYAPAAGYVLAPDRHQTYCHAEQAFRKNGMTWRRALDRRAWMGTHDRVVYQTIGYVRGRKKICWLIGSDFMKYKHEHLFGVFGSALSEVRERGDNL